MKRLMIPVALIAATLVASPATFAQGRELAGAWVLDLEKTGKKEGPQMVVISLDDKEFIARLGRDDAAKAFTFRLDGTETALEDGHKTRAQWKGDKLAATVTSPQGVPETVTFSRDGAWLLMEGATHEGPMKLYFRKAPAK